MNALEVIWDITFTDDLINAKYEYWSVDDRGRVLLLNQKVNPEYLEVSYSPIFWSADSYLPYFDDWETWCFREENEYFIPYEELQPYLDVEIEFESKVAFEGIMKYPLFCVRGTCDKKCCNDRKVQFYCLREVPCTNQRPDWNVQSCKHPSFFDMLYDMVDFVFHCPNTDTLVVNFDFTPIESDRGLDFKYVHSAYLIKGKKITVFKDEQKVKQLYTEYNKKYPTMDRKIEESISDPRRNFIFKF